ncbi:MAG: site-2 protease family protein [Candidatus Omnitrophota bacterium]
MRGSIKLFTILGITIRIHFTFLLLPLVFAHFYGLKGAVLVFFVFCCVTLHELCHSLQARHFGVKVDQIVLLPIGGVAAMRSIPEKPSEEFRISIAGPAFNIILAVVLFFPAYRFLGLENLLHPGIETWPQTLAYAYWINPTLALFNLLPAFPMDGGRVLRAFLADRMDYGKATRIAVSFGHIFAILFGFVGMLSTPPNLILVIIAFFIYMAATQEGMQVDIRLTLRKFYVKDVLPSQFLSVSPLSPLSEVIALTLHGHQEDFPVIDQGKLVGLLSRTNIMQAIHQSGLNTQVKEVMSTQFPTLRVYEPLIKAHKLMEEWKIKAIPVVNDTAVVGVVSLEDISRVYMLMSGMK